MNAKPSVCASPVATSNPYRHGIPFANAVAAGPAPPDFVGEPWPPCVSHAASGNSVDALCKRGIELHAMGAVEEARKCFQRVLRRQPRHVGALKLLSDCYRRAGRWKDEESTLRRAIFIRPTDAEPLSRLGVLLCELGRREEAVGWFDLAIAEAPHALKSHQNRVWALVALGRYEDALVSQDALISLSPCAETYHARGAILCNLKRYEEGMTAFTKAAVLKPTLSEAHLGLSEIYFMLGRFAEGWLAWKQAPRRLPFIQGVPLWRGDEDLAGKNLLIYSEEGLGDTIQFVRYAKTLVEKGANVSLFVHPPLQTLLQHISDRLILFDKTYDIASIDFQCSTLDLLGALGIMEETADPCPTYIHAPSGRRAEFAKLLGSRKTDLRVGLAWSGNPQHYNDFNRSMSFETIAPLLSRHVEWFTLQKDIRPSDTAAFEANGRVKHLRDEMGDFSDTAALLDSMDLVITVDTSIAHLAGAMGKPVWIMLPDVADWRWFLDRTDSPWYRSARLFRQSVAGDWPRVIEEVKRALDGFIPPHECVGDLPASR